MANKIKVYRVQDRYGRGPFKFLNLEKIDSHKYIEHDKELMEKLKARFHYFETTWDYLPTNWVFGCASIEDIKEWFGSTFHNIWEISNHEYMIFEGEVGEDDYYVSQNQIIFNRDKANLKILLVDDTLEDLQENDLYRGYFEQQINLGYFGNMHFNRYISI